LSRSEIIDVAPVAALHVASLKFARVL